MLQQYKGSIQQKKRARRHQRVRGKIAGTGVRPRICITRFQEHLYVQVIDDVAQKTLLGRNSTIIEQKGTKTERASKLGEVFGKLVQEKGIETIVFDRGGYRYHGRVAAFAEGLRKSGLKF